MKQSIVSLACFLLRVVAGFLLLQAGASKLFAWPVDVSAGAEIAMWSQPWFGAVLELAGGALIILGLFTRLVALVLAAEMALAYWQLHASNGLWPVQNGGVQVVLFCVVFLFIAAYGGGAWSVDGGRTRARVTAAMG